MRWPHFPTGIKFELYPLELLAKDISDENTPKIANGFAGIISK